MTINTDKVSVENGTDFTFVCRNIPFAISCSSVLPHGDVNLIDLDLLNKMKIPLRNIRVTRMSLLGHDVRAVGRIKQTIQCVRHGRVQGTVHLEGKVVRDLFSIFGVDCLASSRTYERLVGSKPPEPPDEGYDSNEDIENLDGPPEEAEEGKKDVDDVEDAEVHQKAEEENKIEEPPDRNIPPNLSNLNADHDNNDLDDFLRNAPWSHECVPRKDANADDLYAAAHGYPDTRYGPTILAKLGPTDLRIASMQEDLASDDQDDEEDDRYHADFGVKNHTPHLYSMRNQTPDLDEYAAKHGHYDLQPRGPRGRTMVTRDEDEEHDELAALFGYPPGPRGRARRM